MHHRVFLCFGLLAAAACGGKTGDETASSGAPGAPAPGARAPRGDGRFACEPHCTPLTIASKEISPWSLVLAGSDLYWASLPSPSHDGGRIRFSGASANPLGGTLLSVESPELVNSLAASGENVFASGTSRLSDSEFAETIVSLANRPPVSPRVLAKVPVTLRSGGIVGPVASDGRLYYVLSGDSMDLMSMPEGGGAAVRVAALAGSTATALAVDDTYVYIATRDATGNIALVIRVTKATGAPYVLADETSLVLALAADGEDVYWGSYADEAVKKKPREGGLVVTVAKNQRWTRAMTATSENIYWVTAGSREGASDGSLGPTLRPPKHNALVA